MGEEETALLRTNVSVRPSSANGKNFLTHFMLCMNLPTSNISKSEVDCIKIDDGSEIQQQILLRILDKIAMTDSMQHPPPSSLLRNSSLLGHHRFPNKNLTIFLYPILFCCYKRILFLATKLKEKNLIKKLLLPFFSRICMWLPSVPPVTGVRSSTYT